MFRFKKLKIIFNLGVCLDMEVRNRFLRYHALRKVKAASDKRLQQKNSPYPTLSFTLQKDWLNSIFAFLKLLYPTII